jgi:hypothetical protein
MTSAMVKELVARMLGVGSAATTTFLWCTLLFFNPYDAECITGGTYVVGTLMIILALLAAWGAFALRLWVLVVAFVASFFPVGFYFLGASSIFALVGVANVLHLIAAIVLITDC